MKDTEKWVVKGRPRNPPTAMRDSALAGHPSSTSADRHSSTVGNLAVKMENATASKKYVILEKFPAWDRTAFSKNGSNWFRLGNQRAYKHNVQ
ncbi:hypothetical protein M0802_015385 [Mischocyttarus mexicanus]|nr:hypothetical protein M0802_015385 [Mischocyttarus mexicanus]